MKYYGDESSELCESEKKIVRYRSISLVVDEVYRFMCKKIQYLEDVSNSRVFDELDDVNMAVAIEETDVAIRTYREILDYLESM